MDNTKYIALSRQMGLWNQLGVVSNNMANMNTSGFKQDNILFKSYLSQTPNAQGFGSSKVHFSQDFGSYSDFSEGNIVSTGNTFDLAIKGDGFFVVETDEGEKYTRKGNLALDVDGKLVTSDGFPILSESGTPFFIAPGEKDISVSESGDVSTENGVIGKIKLVEFEDNNKLEKIGSTMFDNPKDNKVSLATKGTIAQGYIEKSNVNAISEMTSMINIQRSYDFIQQMINDEHDRLSKTISTYAQLI